MGQLPHDGFEGIGRIGFLSNLACPVRPAQAPRMESYFRRQSFKRDGGIKDVNLAICASMHFSFKLRLAVRSKRINYALVQVSQAREVAKPFPTVENFSDPLNVRASPQRSIDEVGKRQVQMIDCLLTKLILGSEDFIVLLHFRIFAIDEFLCLQLLNNQGFRIGSIPNLVPRIPVFFGRWGVQELKG